LKKHKLAPFIGEQGTFVEGQEKGVCERIDGLSREREEISLRRDVFMAIWSESLPVKKTEQKAKS